MKEGERMIKASDFKARCLAILDEVGQSGQPLTITKRGRRVARLVPLEEIPSLRGSVTYNVDDDELIAPLADPWNAATE